MKLFSSIVMLITSALIFTAQEKGTYKVEDLVSKFKSTDAFTRRIAFEEFEKRVPAADRADALSDMWELANSQQQRNVPSTILAYLLEPHHEGPLWNQRLRDHVLDVGNSGDPIMKRLVINVLKQQKDHVARSRLLSFLEDQDDGIREAAIMEISRWDDSYSILSAYVKLNERKKERAASVKKAKFFLNKHPAKQRGGRHFQDLR
jgi:hypothetical protein